MIDKLDGIIIDKYYEFEEMEPSLSNSMTYYIEETYEFFYSIKNRSAHDLTIKLDTQFYSEIELSNDKVKKNTVQQFSIILKPTSEGQKSFQLFADLPRIHKEILKKIFNVKLKSIKIEKKIDKPLPKIMKLGQKAETIFLFTNKGNQAITNVSIDIKQIEVTQ